VGLRILAGKLAGTYSPTGEGKFFFTMMAAFAELERDILQERRWPGWRRPARRGGSGPAHGDGCRQARGSPGAPRKGESPTQIATALGVSRASVYRHLAAAEQPPPEGGGDEQAPCSVGGVRDNQPVLNLRNHPSVNSPRKTSSFGTNSPAHTRLQAVGTYLQRRMARGAGNAPSSRSLPWRTETGLVVINDGVHSPLCCARLSLRASSDCAPRKGRRRCSAGGGFPYCRCGAARRAHGLPDDREVVAVPAWRLRDFRDDDLDQAIAVWDQSRQGEEPPPMFPVSEVMAAARARLLREGDLDEVGPLVRSAARVFAATSSPGPPLNRA